MFIWALCTFYTNLKEIAAVHHCSNRAELGIYWFISERFCYSYIIFQYLWVPYFLFLRALSTIKLSVLESHKALRGLLALDWQWHSIWVLRLILPKEAKQYPHLLCVCVNLSGSTWPCGASTWWQSCCVKTWAFCTSPRHRARPICEHWGAVSAPNASAEPTPRGPDTLTQCSQHGGCGKGPKKEKEIWYEKALAGNSSRRLT